MALTSKHAKVRAAIAGDHTPLLVLSRHLHATIHGGGRVGAFNALVALKVGAVLGSMAFFWFCLVLDLVALVLGNPQSWTAPIWVAFLSQTVIQLLALPVLGVIANVQQAASDARARADHDTLVAIHDLSAVTASIQNTQLAILERLDAASKP